MKCFTCVPASAVTYLLEKGKLDHAGYFTDCEMAPTYLDIKDIQTATTGKDYFNYPLFFTVKTETNPYLELIESWEDVEWTIHFEVKEGDNAMCYLAEDIDYLFLNLPVYHTGEEVNELLDNGTSKNISQTELKENWTKNLPLSKEELEKNIGLGYFIEGVIDAIKAENVTTIQRTSDFLQGLRHQASK